MNKLPFSPLTARGLAELADDRALVTSLRDVFELRRAATDRALADVLRASA